MNYFDGKIYLWTNENIDGYLEPFKNNEINRAFTILSSGDQLFNLITLGAKDIDTSDTNSMQEPYALGFKKAMIEKYNYEDFMAYMHKTCNGMDGSLEILDSIIPSMDSKYREYWKQILDKQDNGFLRKINLDSYANIFNFAYKRNLYLSDEAYYNKLRENIGNCNINYDTKDAYNCYSTFNGKYDAILLSNILDYIKFNYKDLFYYDKKLKRHLNDKGIIFLHYIFYFPYPPLFTYSDIKKSDLKDFEMYEFENISPNFKDKHYDGMILSRHKN